MRLIYSDLVSPAFARKVVDVARRLETDPDYLMAAMHFETAGTFDPAVRNPHSGATGLIQFMPHTARRLGTSVDALAQMTAPEQLDWVETYFEPHAGHLATLEDVYMAILWPDAIGAQLDWVLFSGADGAVYRQNVGLDANDDGRVTKREAAAPVRRRYRRERRRV